MRNHTKKMCFLYMLLAVLAAMLLSQRDIVAEERTNKFATISSAVTVSLEVDADGPLEGIVASYLRRDLRSLEDVTIASESADFELSVVVLNVGGAYAISSVGLQVQMTENVLNAYEEQGFVPEDARYILERTVGTGNIVHHLLQIGSENEVESLCSELIASFENNAIEPNRIAVRNFNDGIQDFLERGEN